MGRLFLAVTIAVAAALLTATAQTQTIEIRGITMDADGAPLPGVEIQIRKLDRVPIIRTRSASDGSFRVPGLTPGTYRVIATMGDRAAIREGVTFPPASSADLHMRLDRSPSCRLARVEGRGGIHGRIVDWLDEPTPAFVWLEADDRNDDRRLSCQTGWAIRDST